MTIAWVPVGDTWAKVDIDDLDKVIGYRWHTDSDGYARTTVGKRPKQTTIRMHQLIVGPKSGLVVDHKNQVVTDNRRSNLRHATLTENNYNAKVRVDNISGRRGVSAYGKQWRVQYMKEGKRTHGGYFRDILDAATAYNFYLLEVSNGFGIYNEVEQPWLESV